MSQIVALKEALANKDADVTKLSAAASELNSKIQALEAALTKKDQENQTLLTTLTQKEEVITLSEKRVRCHGDLDFFFSHIFTER